MTHRKATGISPRREPSGRLSRATMDAIDAVSPAAAKRLRDAALQKHADPLWGSEIGRLFLCHKLTAAQFEAAKRWQRLAVEYYLAIGAPPPHEKPGTLGSVGMINGYGLGDDPPSTAAEGRRLRERRFRYHRRDGSRPCRPRRGLAEALRWTLRARREPRRPCRAGEPPPGARRAGSHLGPDPLEHGSQVRRELRCRPRMQD